MGLYLVILIVEANIIFYFEVKNVANKLLCSYKFILAVFRSAFLYHQIPFI